MQKIASKSSPSFKRGKDFIQEHHSFLELQSETTPAGRYYITPNGQRLPSVTTVLGRKLDKSGLLEWRARVGEAKANEISRKATTRGTSVHKALEMYLKNEDVSTLDRKSTRLNSSHVSESRMPSSA